MNKLRVGVSSCLLGNPVRFDGGHRQDRFVADTLSRYVDFVPVCPEVESGLGTPRETLRLVHHGSEVRLRGSRSGTDHTRLLTRYAERKVDELERMELAAFVLKKDSPSCGMSRVRIYAENGMPSRQGRGLFAKALAERMPLLPIEEEGRLNDPRLRENFFERVFAYQRVKSLFESDWRMGDLVRFHTREKMLLLAHDRTAYQELGQLVAHAKGRPRAWIAERYATLFMRGLESIATTRKHTDVLQHLSGHFKERIGRDDRHELARTIEDYRQGLIPLLVPVTLVRHWIRTHTVAYLRAQTYLAQHPKELMLWTQV